MTAPTSRVLQFVAAMACGALLAGGGYALASSGGKTIHGCVADSTHVLTVRSKCPRGTTRLVWNEQGPAGPRGERGLTGAIGATGAAGPAGTVAWTIDYGQIDTSSATGLCGVAMDRGLTDCKYLGVGVYQVTATDCDADNAASTPSNIQLTPDATGSIGPNQGTPTDVVHAEVDGYVSGPSNELTFGIRVLGWDAAEPAPAPIDESVYVLVNC